MIMTKRYVLYVLIPLLCGVLFYSAWAFILWELDVSKWNMGIRILYVLFWATFSVGGISTIDDFNNKFNN